MRQRLEDALAVARRSLDHALVDEEKKHGGRVPELHLGPEPRSAQIVVEMQADVPGGFLDQSREMLVVAVQPVMSQPSGPALAQFTNQ